MPRSDTTLHGRAFKWKFTDGPTAGTVYEHTFNADGTVVYRDASSSGKAKAAGDKAQTEKPAPKIKYASFEVAPGIHLVSYLSTSGYTLTTSMNLGTKQLHGFASNDKEWYPLTGTLES